MSRHQLFIQYTAPAQQPPFVWRCETLETGMRTQGVGQVPPPTPPSNNTCRNLGPTGNNSLLTSAPPRMTSLRDEQELCDEMDGCGGDAELDYCNGCDEQHDKDVRVEVDDCGSCEGCVIMTQVFRHFLSLFPG